MNLEKLLALESAIEGAQCDILIAHGGKAIGEFRGGKVPIPGYTVRLQGVAETRDLSFIRKAIHYPQQWKGVLVTGSRTRRSEKDETSDHADLLARVRACAFNFLFEFNDKNLPLHYVTYMRETGTTRGHDESGIDLTEQHYEIIFQIRDEALPPIE